MSFDRMSERKLGEVAVISLPRSIKEEVFRGIQTDQANRITFTFATSYFWASFGSSTAYKQQIFVSVMAPDATDADYAAMPTHFDLSYDRRRTVRQTALGTGSLTITEGVYRQNTLQEPAHVFLYSDRRKRLQIAWHAVTAAISLEDGVDLVGKMAASFKILSEPTATYAEMRDRPRKEAEDRDRKRSLAIGTLAREGFKDLVPGKPVLRDGIYVEWMAEPEPRFQLLKPLGRVKAKPNVEGGMRPRPASLRNPDGTVMALPGSVGWQEFWEDEWQFRNGDNAYLPFPGVAALLTAQNRDPAYVQFYYAATVRVEESSDDYLTTLRWFYDSVPVVERLWREGKLVRGAIDEAPFPLR